MAKKRKRAVRQTVATCTIWHADEMTKQGRRKLVTWLRSTADHLLKHGDNYAKRFTARYFRV